MQSVVISLRKSSHPLNFPDVDFNLPHRLLCSFRVADELLGALGKNLGDALSPPTYLLTFVHEIFLDAYPPKPESKTEALWALRSLQTVLGECPSEMVSETLDIFIDSLCVWFKDEQHVLTRQEYSSDVSFSVGQNWRRSNNGLFAGHTLVSDDFDVDSGLASYVFNTSELRSDIILSAR